MDTVSRSALVTGISRRVGIGWTVARRLAADGWTVDSTGWPPHDDEMPWGGDSTAAEMDLSFAVNTRATVLLVQAAARVGVRRVVLFTAGVHRDPMPTELPYALSKAALQGITTSLAAALAPLGATVNCVNPGPNDTGYADADTERFVAGRMPLEPRWGRPADTAELVAFLVSDAAGWITGQTIDSDGGWGIRSGVAGR